MDNPILVRFLISIIIILGAIVVFQLFNRFVLARADNKVLSLDGYHPGVPAVLYFTTPMCAPCKTFQRPALERMKAGFGKWFQVIEVDAIKHPLIAQEWGVMSVPTTFVIDAKGKPRHVNHGVASAEKLLEQLNIDDYSI